MDVSIIIPTLNRADLLGQTLRSVAQVASGRADIEVLVVDNGSTDATAAVCQRGAERTQAVGWRYFYDGMPGLLSGRHRGAREAKGEILAFLDDDVLLSPTWLDAVQDAFHDQAVALVGGPSSPSYAVEPPTWLAALWEETEAGRMCPCLSLVDMGRSRKQVDPLLIFGLNFAIRKATFKECGGFHPDCIPKLLQRYQGDGETGLSLKIRDKGLLALYEPAAAVTHVIPASRLTVDGLKQRAFYQGVCDSYAQIRNDRAPPKEHTTSCWWQVVRPLRRVFQQTFGSPEEVIRGVLARAHAAGVTFHQKEVRRDARLLEWVLKPDYFDYALPPGWESYVGK